MKRYFTYADPVIPIHLPRVLVETAVVQGADRDALLDRVGLTPAMLDAPETRISFVQYGRMTKNAFRLTGNPALGLDVGRSLGVPHLGVLGLALISSPTVGEALEAFLRHCRALIPLWDLDLEVHGDRAIFSVHETIPLQAFRTFAIEQLLVACAAHGRHLYGDELPIRRLRLSYPRPSYAARYGEFWSGTVEFDQDATAVELDARMLDKPIQGADPATARLAEEYVARQSQATSERTGAGLLAQIRNVVATPGPAPSMEEVARELQTSTRALRRALQEMGTSFSALVDEERRERAEELVGESNLPFEQVAEQLGFTDVRSFRRAFKRWTGRTPHAFRGAKG